MKRNEIKFEVTSDGVVYGTEVRIIYVVCPAEPDVGYFGEYAELYDIQDVYGNSIWDHLGNQEFEYAQEAADLDLEQCAYNGPEGY